MNGSKTVVHLHNGILHSRRKEGTPTLCDSMDGTGEYNAKWNKSGNGRQISHDCIYNWNLINKTNKQAKYNQTHWNKEQTDSNQRGGRGDKWGKKGKGHQGTCIKDTWTKPTAGRIKGGRQGWVWQGVMVGWRGKKWLQTTGDNCT